MITNILLINNNINIIELDFEEEMSELLLNEYADHYYFNDTECTVYCQNFTDCRPTKSNNNNKHY